MTRHPYDMISKITTCLLLMVVMLTSMPASSSPVTKQEADHAYIKGDYRQAIAGYQRLLRQTRSADLYYNLGNAYYRSDSIAKAILAYERASFLSPGDKDIRFNLQFARSKTIDKLSPENEVVFTTWYRSVVNLASADTWAWISIVSLVSALSLLFVFLFVSRLAWRKIGFFGGVLFVVVFSLSTLFAWLRHHSMTEQRGAVVVAPSVNVKKTPSQSGEDSFILHEGTRVDVTDSSIKSWCGIRLADGREGWVPVSKLEKI